MDKLLLILSLLYFLLAVMLVFNKNIRTTAFEERQEQEFEEPATLASRRYDYNKSDTFSRLNQFYFDTDKDGITDELDKEPFNRDKY